MNTSIVRGLGRHATTIAAAVLFLVVLLRHWLGGYNGYIGPDEALHWTQPWRFLQGDLPFVHEWHPSVLFGVLMTPLLALMRLWGVGTEGFIVISRHIACCVWLLSVVFVWWRWRRVSERGALIGVACFAIWPPWGEAGFGYNLVGLVMVSLAVTLFTTNRKDSVMTYLFSGMCFAVAMICCPHLVLLYFAFSAFTFLQRENMRPWLIVSIGCGIVAVIFCAWVFSKVPLSKALDMLPMVMHDPEHPAKSIVGLVRDVIGRMVFITHDLAWGHASIVFLYGIWLMIVGLDIKRQRHSGLYISLITFFAIVHLSYYCVQPMVSGNPKFLPMVILSGGVAIFAHDEIARRIFRFGWIPAVIYGLCVGFSSNLGIYSIGFAVEAAVIPGVLIIILTVRDGKICRVLVYSFILFHVITLWLPSVRFVLTRYKVHANEYESGIMAGARINNEFKARYDVLMSDTQEMRTRGDVNIVVYLDHANQWLYLSSNKRNGAFSSWTCGVNDSSIERLEEYWNLCPDKFPDAIFVNGKYSQIVEKLISAHGFRKEVSPSGNFVLWKGGIK